MIDRLNEEPIKTPVAFYTEIEKSILGFKWNFKGSKQLKESWQRIKMEDILPDIEIQCRAAIVKRVCSQGRGRHVDEWNRNPK